MFCAAAFVFGSIGQEFVRGVRARRAMAGESPPRALLALVRRNRRRYGGYVVHLGIAVLFIGVAASSSFQHASELQLRPVQSTKVGAYTVRYVRPTALDHAEVRPCAHRLDTGPRRRTRCQKGWPPRRHATRDVWTAIAPNIETPNLKRIVSVGNVTLPPEEGAIALIYLARSYLRQPLRRSSTSLSRRSSCGSGSAAYRLGGLVAVSSAPSTVRRRVRRPFVRLAPARVARALLRSPKERGGSTDRHFLVGSRGGRRAADHGPVADGPGELGLADETGRRGGG